MGGCQNYGPFWGTLNIRCRTIIGDPQRDHNFDNHPCEPWAKFVVTRTEVVGHSKGETARWVLARVNRK